MAAPRSIRSVAAAALLLAGCSGGDGGGADPEPSAVERKPGAVERKPRGALCSPLREGIETVVPRPRWSVGDRLTVTVDKRRMRAGAGSIVRVATARLEVVGRTPDGWRLRLRSDDLLLLPPQMSFEPEAVRPLEPVFENLTIEYATDASGAVTGLHNREAIRRRMGLVVDVIAREARGEPAAEQLVPALRAFLLRDEVVEAIALDDIRLLHEAYGGELREGEPVSREATISSPFGGEPLPATAEVSLDDARGASGCALIQTTVVADREALEESVREQYARAGLEPGEDELARLVVRRSTRSSYDAGSGSVARADATATVESPTSLTEDQTIVTVR